VTAQEYLTAGQPDQALIELQNEIRARPEDPKLRVFLFQLHCLLGNWPKALIQLQVIAGIDPDTMLLAQIFQPVIQCEGLRAGVFDGKLTPLIFGEPLEWVGLLIKAADADVITGSKATFILVDETHVFSQKGKAADIFIEIRGSLAARPDGFLLQITTQSKDPPAGVFKSELNIARDVRDGLIDLPLLPMLYELPLRVAENGGWKDPKTWALVNPNLNRSVDEAYLQKNYGLSVCVRPVPSCSTDWLVLNARLYSNRDL
jgi:hypothetical protein